MKLTLEHQPREFIGRQPPATRKHLKEALHSVESGKIFPEPLRDELDGFYKLKIEGYRFILQHVSGESGPMFRVVFGERRAVVYEIFRLILGLE